MNNILLAMKSALKTTSFGILLLTAILIVGCEKKTAENYDYTHCHKIIDVCNNLTNDAEQSDFLQVNASDIAHPEYRTLLQLLENQLHQRQNLLKAQQLLENGEYDALEQLIVEIENQGCATPELLRLRSLPPALTALSMFCARMPWQDADSIRLAFNWLQPYLIPLNQSEVFKQFYIAQEQELERLKSLTNKR